MVNFAVIAAASINSTRRLYPDNKATNKCGRWIKGAAKLDCSQAQWNPLHALMHSCASRIRKYAWNENTHCNHCGCIRFRVVYTRSAQVLFLSLCSQRVYACVCMCVVTRACTLRRGTRTSWSREPVPNQRINNPAFTCCVKPFASRPLSTANFCFLEDLPGNDFLGWSGDRDDYGYGVLNHIWTGVNHFWLGIVLGKVY